MHWIYQCVEQSMYLWTWNSNYRKKSPSAKCLPLCLTQRWESLPFWNKTAHVCGAILDSKAQKNWDTNLKTTSTEITCVLSELSNTWCSLLIFSYSIQLTTKAAQLGVINAVFVQGSFVSNIRSELARFPHFTYTNFRHIEQVLTAVKLIVPTLPNSLRIGENSSREYETD